MIIVGSDDNMTIHALNVFPVFPGISVHHGLYDEKGANSDGDSDNRDKGKCGKPFPGREELFEC